MSVRVASLTSVCNADLLKGGLEGYDKGLKRSTFPVCIAYLGKKQLENSRFVVALVAIRLFNCYVRKASL